MPRKKNNQFLIRADERDANTIRQKIVSSGLSQQDYLLKAALEASITDPIPIRELLTEYKKQGTNFNQIAKAINAGYSMTPELMRIINDMTEERDAVWQLLKQSTQTPA